MARTADKPGTYRIKEKGYGSYLVSGVLPSGARTRVSGFASRFDAETFATANFGGAHETPSTPVIPKITGPSPIPVTDEWGLPVVTAEQAASVGAAMGIPPTPTVQQTDAKVAEAKAKADLIQANRKKTAKSLTELIGHGYAMGVVMGSQRLVTSAGKVPVKPSPKQVTDLAEVTRDTMTEMFGDHEVKPWIMMILLSVGIPLSMWIQSPKAPPKTLPAASPNVEDISLPLRSVT